MQDLQHFQQRVEAFNFFNGFVSQDIDWVLVYTGFSGHGKSTFFHWLCKNHCPNLGLKPIYVDFTNINTPLSLLDFVFEQSLADFDVPAYKKYREEYQNVLRDRDTRSIGTLFSQEMSNSPNSSQTINAGLTDFTDALNVNARARITEIWLDAAREIVADNTIIFLDSFEVFSSSPTNLQWLWEALERLRRRIPTLTVVIGTQTHSIGRDESKRSFDLSRFSLSESNNLLQSMGVTDANYQQAVFERLAQGHPLVTSLAGNLWLQTGGDISDQVPNIAEIKDAVLWIQTKIIDRLDNPLKTIVRWCGLLRYFNLDIIKALITNVEVDESDFRTLQSYSFVESSQYNNHWKFHSLLRQGQIEYLQKEQPDTFLRFHAKAHYYFAGRENIEALYHHFFVNNEQAHFFWRNVTQISLITANDETPQLFQIIYEPEIKLDNNQATWVNYLEAKQAYLHDDYETAKQLLEKVIDNAKTNKIALLEAHALLSLSRIETSSRQHDLAIQHLQKARKIYEERGEINGIANTYQQLANIEGHKGNELLAQEYYEYANKLYKTLGIPSSQANALRGLGEVALKQNKKTAAEKYFRKAFKLCEQASDKRGMANILLYLGWLEPTNEAAMKSFHDALEIYKQVGNKRGEANALYQLCSYVRDEIATPLVEKRKDELFLVEIRRVRDWLTQVLQLYDELKDEVFYADTLFRLGECQTYDIDTLGDALVNLYKSAELHTKLGKNKEAKAIMQLIQDLENEYGNNIELYQLIVRWIQIGTMNSSFAYVQQHQLALLTDEAEGLLEKLHQKKPDWGTVKFLPLLKACRKVGIFQAYNLYWQDH